VFSFLGTDAYFGEKSALGEVRRSPGDVVRIRRQDVHVSLIQHPIGPVLGPSTEPSGKRPRCDLNPNSSLHEAEDGSVSGLDPRQSFRVGQDWHVARCHQIKKKLFQPGWKNVMGRFDQDITRIAQAQEVPRADPRHNIWDDADVGASYKLEGNAFLIERLLQAQGGLADLRP
jgi:hypothetical protein